MANSNRIACALAVLCVTAALDLAAQVTSLKPSLPEQAVHEFYTWYFQRLAAKKSPVVDEPQQLRPYVTSKLLGNLRRQANSADGMAADYFLQAQDWLPNWPKQLSARHETVGKTNSTVILVLGESSDAGAVRRRIHLRFEAGRWKVSRVERL